jgi:outer membrane immunogenic protein
MKKLVLIGLFTAFAVVGSFAQGTLGKGGKQLNAGLGFSSWGVPVYVGLDFGVHESITIGPKFSYRKYSENYAGLKYSQSLAVLGFNGNYHFNKLINLDSKWDLYAGLTLGYYIWSDVKWSNNSFDGYDGKGSGVGLDAQIGVRYFFNDKFGLNLELGGGTGSGGSFGITYKF